MVTPNPGTRPLALSRSFGCQVPSITCNMLGFGACGVTKKNTALARFSHVSATSSGLSSRVLTVPNIASENGP
ncbi:hypothetical protein D3C80_1787510 [compost metagenome]